MVRINTRNTRNDSGLVNGGQPSMSDLPPMDGQPTQFKFEKDTTRTKGKVTDVVKPDKRTVSKVHEREEGPSKDKQFKCEGLAPECTFSTDFKSAYTNHIKIHKPDILALYSGELVQIWQPFGSGELMWDAEKSIYVSPNQIVIPEGFELYKLTGKLISKTVPNRTHDGGIRSVDFMEIIIRRVKEAKK